MYKNINMENDIVVGCSWKLRSQGVERGSGNPELVKMW